MAHVKKVFFGTHQSGTIDTELNLYDNTNNEIFISIESEDDRAYICLDVETAVQLAKELRKYIGYLKQADSHE